MFTASLLLLVLIAAGLFALLRFRVQRKKRSALQNTVYECPVCNEQDCECHRLDKDR
jgi:hypothetical protein